VSPVPDVDVVAVLVATLAAFVLGFAYYTAFGERLAEVSDAAARAEQPPPWKLAVELLRCLLVAAVVAGLASQGEIETWAGGLCLGLALWVGFPLVLWVGAVIWENTPRKLAVIHGGDWLAKLLAVGLIAGVWQ
jgi:hypothetical protein